MPYTPTTPTLLLCDALVAAVQASWVPTGQNRVKRGYFARVGDSDAGEHKLAGRLVVIYPTDYSSDPASRGEDECEHRVTVDVFERYVDDGDPPDEWIDVRVDFVYEQIVQGLDYSHTGPPTWNRKLLTRSFDVAVCSVSDLLTKSLFFSRVDLVFSEIRDA